MSHPNKTQATEASVDTYLGSIADAGRRQDCEALVKLMTRVTKQPATMWGTAIVGFDRHLYKYESGREGEICLVGFSSRKGDISLYGTASAPNQKTLLAKLGRHRMGKGCLTVRRLEDVDLKVLEQLVRESVAFKRANAG